MSGHSKWHNIQKKKGAVDAKRGQVFTKLAKGITVAAKDGGGDPDMNFRLRVAIDAAKAQNMPKANIERAIQRGAGGGDGGSLDEVLYEAFGPGGTALLIEVVTDNRNRAVAEVKNILNKTGGRFADAGSVKWMFEHRSVVLVESPPKDFDELELTLIDAGADDIQVEKEGMTVLGDMTKLRKLKEAVETSGLTAVSAELAYVPKQTVAIAEDVQKKLEVLMDALDDNEDVVNVYANDR